MRIHWSIILLAAAILLIPGAWALGGINILTLIGAGLAGGAIVWELAHTVRTAPLVPGEYSRLDELDGLTSRIEETAKREAWR